jgi:peptidoglycan/LPS O-acetylase OafA/YrhL
MTDQVTANNRHAVLDGVRGLCAAGVVVHHLVISSASEWVGSFHAVLYYTPFEALFSGGKFVRVFFVISGFVLFASYASSKSWSCGEFYLRRFARLWLPFVAASLLSVGLSFLTLDSEMFSGLSPWLRTIAQPGEITLQSWAEHVGLLGSASSILLNCVTWSLTHEVRFVLIFPLIAAAIVRWDIAVLLTSMVVAIAASAIYIYIPETGFFSTAETWTGAICSTAHYLPFFIIGMVLAKRCDSLCHWVGTRGPLEILGFWMIAFLLMRRSESVVSCVGVAAAIVLVLNCRIFQILSQHYAIGWLGRVSYSLYLVHMPILIFCAFLLSDLLPEEGVLIAALIASFLVAEIFDKLVTVRSIVAGKRAAVLFRQFVTQASVVQGSAARGNGRTYILIRKIIDRLPSMSGWRLM